MTRYALNEGWGFTPDWHDALLGAPASSAPEDDPLMRLLKVRLPHTVKEMPLDCFDDADFQLLSGYVRRLEAPPANGRARRFDSSSTEPPTARRSSATANPSACTSADGRPESST